MDRLRGGSVMAYAALSKLRPLLARAGGLQLRAMSTNGTEVQTYEYETLSVKQRSEWVKEVQLNRPEKRNAMNEIFWKECLDCFQKLSTDSSCRAILLTGAGKIFTAGLDLVEFAPKLLSFQSSGTDPGRRFFSSHQMIGPLQQSISAIEKCQKPVIAAVHSACVGGGVDMITACDVRVCSHDAWFQVKEVDIGLVADLGTVQRLPKIVSSDSWAREIIFTGRKVTAEEALKFGLVSSVFPDKETTVSEALKIAQTIAEKSPVAVQGAKVNLNYSRDHSVEEGLNFVAVWNAALLQSEDVGIAGLATIQKEKPVFSKL